MIRMNDADSPMLITYREEYPTVPLAGINAFSVNASIFGVNSIMNYVHVFALIAASPIIP